MVTTRTRATTAAQFMQAANQILNGPAAPKPKRRRATGAAPKPKSRSAAPKPKRRSAAAKPKRRSAAAAPQSLFAFGVPHVKAGTRPRALLPKKSGAAAKCAAKGMVVTYDKNQRPRCVAAGSRHLHLRVAEAAAFEAAMFKGHNVCPPKMSKTGHKMFTTVPVRYQKRVRIPGTTMGLDKNGKPKLSYQFGTKTMVRCVRPSSSAVVKQGGACPFDYTKKTTTKNMPIAVTSAGEPIKTRSGKTRPPTRGEAYALKSMTTTRCVLDKGATYQRPLPCPEGKVRVMDAGSGRRRCVPVGMHFTAEDQHAAHPARPSGSKAPKKKSTKKSTKPKKSTKKSTKPKSTKKSTKPKKSRRASSGGLAAALAGLNAGAPMRRRSTRRQVIAF